MVAPSLSLIKSPDVWLQSYLLDIVKWGLGKQGATMYVPSRLLRASAQSGLGFVMDQAHGCGCCGCRVRVFTRSPPFIDDMPLFQADVVVAELVDLFGIVGDEQKGHALSAQLADLRETLFLKGLVADGENLVGQDDVWLQMDGDRKAQAHLHA